MKRRAIRSRGYSLTELLTVVAMIGVVTLISLPAVMQLMPQYQIRSAASESAATIRQMRQRAMSTRTTHRILFDPVNDRYSLWMLNTQTSTLSAVNSWTPLTKDARRTTTAEEWINASAVDLRTNTANPFKDVVFPDDSKVDLIFLRDGSVSPTPEISDTDELTFDPLPSIVFAVDNDLVKFNRYYIQLSRRGNVTIDAEKE